MDASKPQGSALQLPFTGRQLLKLCLRAAAIVLFWPLAWLWLAHYVVSHCLLVVGWEPLIPTKHSKVRMVCLSLRQQNGMPPGSSSF